MVWFTISMNHGMVPGPYKWGLKVEVWFQSDPHDAVYGKRWGEGYT